jgi:hypothetical protein
MTIGALYDVILEYTPKENVVRTASQADFDRF